MGLLVPWVLEYPGWYPDPRETAAVYTKFPCSSEASQTFHVTIFFNKVWGCGLLWLLKLWSEFSNQSWQDDPTIKSVHSSSPMTGVRTLGPVVVKDKAYTAVLWLPQVCPSIHPLSHTHHTNIRKIKTNEDFLLNLLGIQVNEEQRWLGIIFGTWKHLENATVATTVAVIIITLLPAAISSPSTITTMVIRYQPSWTIIIISYYHQPPLSSSIITITIIISQHH